MLRWMEEGGRSMTDISAAPSLIGAQSAFVESYNENLSPLSMPIDMTAAVMDQWRRGIGRMILELGILGKCSEELA